MEWRSIKKHLAIVYEKEDAVTCLFSITKALTLLPNPYPGLTSEQIRLEVSKLLRRRANYFVQINRVNLQFKVYYTSFPCKVE